MSMTDMPAGAPASGKKRIILLLDGTWNDRDFGNSDTNIVRLQRIIAETLRDRKDTGDVRPQDPTKITSSIDDVDGTPLVQREDDQPETVRNRLAVYHEQTAPLVAYYDDLGLLQRFDGTASPNEVAGHIRATISTLRREEEI